MRQHQRQLPRTGSPGRPQTPQAQPSPTYLVYDASLQPPATTTPSRNRFAHRALARDRTPQRGGEAAPEYRGSGRGGAHAALGGSPGSYARQVLFPPSPDPPAAAECPYRIPNLTKAYSPVPPPHQTLDVHAARSPSPGIPLPYSDVAPAPTADPHGAFDCPRSVSPARRQALPARSASPAARARYVQGHVQDLYRSVSEPVRFRKMFEKCLRDLRDEQDVLAKVRRFLSEILALKQGGGKGGLLGVRSVIQSRRAKREVNRASSRRAAAAGGDEEREDGAAEGSPLRSPAPAHADAVDSALRQMAGDVEATVDVITGMLQQVAGVETQLEAGRSTVTNALRDLSDHVALRPSGAAEDDQVNPLIARGQANPDSDRHPLPGSVMTPRTIPTGDDPFKSLSEVEAAVLKSVTLRKECRRRIGLIDANNRRLLDKVEKALEVSIAQEERQLSDTQARLASLQEENTRLGTQQHLLQSSLQERIKEREIVSKRLQLRQQRPLLGEDHDKVCEALAGEMDALSSAVEHFRSKHDALAADITRLKAVCHQLSADAAATARLLAFDKSVLAQPW
eukprot:TRINITY_DN27368_c0_g1_i1.p1 TRINITY_DN27368_c0_g1~~TRINITY_DN27368_c0_g1_i1.p1  ORF type:complete len:657 (+),score=236.18 TRINITY_DN27368_c0_g1_i1:268-1971(+)